MDGDFKGDFTRDSFDLFKHFSRVLMQQGRVQLDADWNEQTDILLRYLRTLAADVIGPFGGPITGSGFQITSPQPQQKEDGFSISSGHYYVDGILIENPDVDEQGQPITVTYKHQPYNPIPDDLPTTGEVLLLAYVDVWELQISFVQDDGIREVALGVNGPDTATRALVVWQVKTLDAEEINIETIRKAEGDQGDQGIKDIEAYIKSISGSQEAVRVKKIRILTAGLQDVFVPPNRGLLRARAKGGAQDTTDVCITPPDARYRGPENQLYRVEIHNGGNVGSTTGSDTPRRTGARRASGAKASASGGEGTTSPTIKWSREDASVVFPIGNIEGTLITLANLGRDEHLGLQKDDWVEVVDDDYVLQIFGNPNAQPNPLLRVDDVDPINMIVTLSAAPQIQQPFNLSKHPILRRWDQTKTGGPPDRFNNATGTVNIVESQGETNDVDADWITLEDGVQIQFPHLPNDPAAMYRPGDYWLIPARTIIGDVEWPQKADPAGKLPSVAVSLPPHGVEHHYAPLAHFQLVRGKIQDDSNIDDRWLFKSLVELSFA
jgi:hypothetical protein